MTQRRAGSPQRRGQLPMVVRGRLRRKGPRRCKCPVLLGLIFHGCPQILDTPLIMGQRVCLLDEALDMLDVAEQLIRLAPFTFVKLTPSQLRRTPST